MTKIVTESKFRLAFSERPGWRCRKEQAEVDIMSSEARPRIQPPRDPRGNWAFFCYFLFIFSLSPFPLSPGASVDSSIGPKECNCCENQGVLFLTETVYILGQ
ncbi:hypothetical protein VTK26DRAFT_3509 [Humicola hyalothermophila]